MEELRYAILIGVGQYDPNEPKLPPLRCPSQDVAGLADLLESDIHGPYLVKRLVNVSHVEALDAIYDVFINQAKRDDLVLLYYSGHGKPDSSGDLYLATANTRVNRLPLTSIPLDVIGRWMQQCKSTKIVLILDCCYSGAVERLFTRGEVADQISQTLPKQLNGRGTYVLTASTDIQLAEEKEGDEYGLLTKHVITGIRDGRADRDDDGVVSMNELLAYVQQGVQAEGLQRPQGFALRVEGGELAIAKTGKPPGNERRRKVTQAIFAAAGSQPIPSWLVRAVIDSIEVPTVVPPDVRAKFDERVDKLHHELGDSDRFVEAMYEIAYESRGAHVQELTKDSVRPEVMGEHANRRGEEKAELEETRREKPTVQGATQKTGAKPSHLEKAKSESSAREKPKAESEEEARKQYGATYGNYLPPTLRLFSLNAWTLAATVLRRMFLNCLVLLPVVAALLLIPVLFWRVMWVRPSEVEPLPLWLLLVVGLILGGQATAYVGFDLPSAGDAERSPKYFLIYCLVPLSLAASALNIFWAWLPSGATTARWWDVVSLGKEGVAWWHFTLFGAVMHGGGMLVGLGHVKFRFHRPPTRTGIVATSAAFLAGFVGGLAAWAISRLAAVETDYSDFLQDPRLYSCLAFPMLMGVFLFSGTLRVGSTYVTKDEDRERSAWSGWFLAVSLGWLILALVTLYSPVALNWLDSTITAGIIAITVFLGFVVARATNGYQPLADAEVKGTIFKAFGKRGPQLLTIAFIILLVMLLVALNERILIAFGPPAAPTLWGFTSPVLWLGLGYGALSFIASRFININDLSHGVSYRQRLAQAYLGASDPLRNSHPFSGFDET